MIINMVKDNVFKPELKCGWTDHNVENIIVHVCFVTGLKIN